MVVDFGIFYIRKVFYTEELFGFSRAVLGNLNGLILYVERVILVGNKRFYKAVAVEIKRGGLFASARNYKRSSRLVD